jgi:hypothetical protein
MERPRPPHQIDPAALVAAVLAVVLAMLLGEGAWDRLSCLLGGTLLLVLTAYLPDAKPTGNRRVVVFRALAISAVISLAASITLAFPLQELLVRPDLENAVPLQLKDEQVGELLYEKDKLCNTSSPEGVADARQSRIDECAGTVTTLKRLPWCWIGTMFATTLLILAWWLRRPIRDEDDRPSRVHLGPLVSRN